MSKTEIKALILQLKQASTLRPDLLAEAVAATLRVFPKAAQPPEAGASSVEEVLQVIDFFLPGWAIQLTGKALEPDGHWRCSLRETRGSDEDEAVGLGSGPDAGLALIQALLHVAYQKSRV